VKRATYITIIFSLWIMFLLIHI